MHVREVSNGTRRTHTRRDSHAPEQHGRTPRGPHGIGPEHAARVPRSCAVRVKVGRVACGPPPRIWTAPGEGEQEAEAERGAGQEEQHGGRVLCMPVARLWM